MLLVAKFPRLLYRLLFVKIFVVVHGEICVKMEDLPFKAEYAKTGRASCKGCKNKIDQATLRIAAMVQVRLKSLIFRN